MTSFRIVSLVVGVAVTSLVAVLLVGWSPDRSPDGVGHLMIPRPGPIIVVPVPDSSDAPTEPSQGIDSPDKSSSADARRAARSVTTKTKTARRDSAVKRPSGQRQTAPSALPEVSRALDEVTSKVSAEVDRVPQIAEEIPDTVATSIEESE